MDPREYDWQMGDLADQAIYPDERYMQPPPRDDPWPQQFLPSPGDPAPWKPEPTQLARWPADPSQMTANEAAAFRAQSRYRNALARDPESNRMGALAEMIAPQSPLDYALLASGPVAKAASVPARAALYGGVMALDPDKAEAMLAGKMSKTADLDLYKKAMEMLRYGKTGPEIRKETNWFPTAGSILKYEIPDYKTGWVQGEDPSKIPRMFLPAGAPAGRIYNHPAAYEAYPSLRDVPVTVTPQLGKGVRGGFQPPEYVGDQPKVFLAPASSAQMKSVMGHELFGHGTQNLEPTWSIGGNPTKLLLEMKEGTPQWNAYQRMLEYAKKPLSFEEYAVMLKGTSLPVTEAGYKTFLESTAKHGISQHLDDRLRLLAAHQTYRKGVGEEEARAIEARMGLSPKKLNEIPFEQSLETPFEQQIFNYREPLKQQPKPVTSQLPPPQMGSLADQRIQLSQEPLTGFVPGSTFEAKSPAIVPARSMPTAEDIAAIKAAAVQYGRKGWPTTERGVFATTPEAYAETTQLVPQTSIKGQLPGPLPGEKLPRGGRAALIAENPEQIGSQIAEKLEPLVKQDSPLLKFYHTGPIVRGLEQYGGRTIPEANVFLRDWAGQGAGTSMRTSTPPNLRNSSYLMYERARGNPLTPERFQKEGNIPGYTMMGEHVKGAERFATGTENLWTNPKPGTFRENWSGNLMDVTGDTHLIRSTLVEADRIAPGSFPRSWFSSDEAYKMYRDAGGFEKLPTQDLRKMLKGDIADTLESVTVKKVPRQSEYLPITEPWYRAAQKLGIAPAEAQSGGWFSYGDLTGLKSPPKTIVNLLNDQVAATARELRVPPEKVVEWWSQGKIPLAGFAGAGALAPAVMGDLARQDQYQ